jgi:glycosyltransferase involved in cell wall biosynthesis
MRAGVYCTSWEYAGGGEKLLAVTAGRLAVAGYDVCLYGPTPPPVERLQNVLAVRLDGCRVSPARSGLEPLLRAVGRVSPRAERVIRGRTELRFARGLDLFVYITGEIPPACPAPRGILFIQFPYNPEEAIRVDAGGRPLRAAGREKLARLRSWSSPVCPSQFVREWVRERWRIPAAVVYPPSETSACQALEKTRTILTVGRFYAAGNNKKHAVMVRAFRELCDEGLSGWELLLAGGTHPRDDHQAYLREVRALADGYPVRVLTDLRFDEVVPLYGGASLYWHATGAGEDANKQPERFEQFGMTVVEAMAAGAVPLVFGGGGPAEIVRDGVDGFLWRDATELKRRTLELISRPDLLASCRASATVRSSEFSREKFESAIDAVIAGDGTGRAEA